MVFRKEDGQYKRRWCLERKMVNIKEDGVKKEDGEYNRRWCSKIKGVKK